MYAFETTTSDCEHGFEGTTTIQFKLQVKGNEE